MTNAQINCLGDVGFSTWWPAMPSPVYSFMSAQFTNTVPRLDVLHRQHYTCIQLDQCMRTKLSSGLPLIYQRNQQFLPPHNKVPTIFGLPRARWPQTAKWTINTRLRFMHSLHGAVTLHARTFTFANSNQRNTVFRRLILNGQPAAPA